MKECEGALILSQALKHIVSGMHFMYKTPPLDVVNFVHK